MRAEHINEVQHRQSATSATSATSAARRSTCPPRFWACRPLCLSTSLRPPWRSWPIRTGGATDVERARRTGSGREQLESPVMTRLISVVVDYHLDYDFQLGLVQSSCGSSATVAEQQARTVGNRFECHDWSERCCMRFSCRLTRHGA